MKFFHYLSFSLLFCTIFSANAQGLTREQVDDTIEKMPAFSIHKNNYFISGVPLSRSVSDNSDAKYQISFKQLLSRNTLPLNTYLFLTYTQKAFWDLYSFSSPFSDINFNPGIGLGKPIFNKDNKLMAMAYLQYEHESNGRDSIYSRTWNRLSLSFETDLSSRTSLRVKAWLPFSYKIDNPDLIEYMGYGEVNLSYDLQPEKWTMDLQLRKGSNLDDWKGSVRAQLFYNPFKMTNQYLMLEWYNGYGESLLDYDQFRSMIRVGYVIKSNNLNFFKFSGS
ncbi:phospholipase A [Salegentibacter sp. F188]|uniref:Phosphatidylcholine 1-acylhydrolase n=1 Tax=Autumnicola patrickiae TaxID=3075591 RepID=A0ABU3E5K2_9FLAO|nr:phospholipase A [Salegentibacter sp. F188]MDT0691286.1 phospholipase A [Salegentibacter sp. F188]